MLWRNDKLGPGIMVDESCKVLTHSGPTVGCALLDQWLSTSSSSFDSGSVILDIAWEGTEGELWVGVVGRNFNPTSFGKEAFFPRAIDGKDEIPTDLANVFHSATGRYYSKGSDKLAGRLCAFGRRSQPQRCQLELSMRELMMQANLIDMRAAKAAVDGITASVKVDGLKPEVAVCVAFGGQKEGSKCTVRVVGSSTEKTGRSMASKDWDGDKSSGSAPIEMDEETRIATELS